MVHAVSVVETGVVLTRPERFAVTAEIVFAITSSRVLDEVLANVARRTAEALDVWECDIYDYRPAENCTVGLALWSREPASGRRRLGRDRPRTSPISRSFAGCSAKAA